MKQHATHSQRNKRTDQTNSIKPIKPNKPNQTYQTNKAPSRLGIVRRSILKIEGTDFHGKAENKQPQKHVRTWDGTKHRKSSKMDPEKDQKSLKHESRLDTS